MLKQSSATRSPLFLLGDDGNRHGDAVTTSDITTAVGDDVMRTSGGRSLFLEQFLQDTSTQREIDSILFVWSFLQAVSTCTLESGVSDGRRGHQVPELAVELSPPPRVVAWVLLSSVSTGSFRSLRTILAWSTCPTRPPTCSVQPPLRSSFLGMRGRSGMRRLRRTTVNSIVKN